MTKLMEVLGTPAPATIGGQPFTLSPLTLADMAQLQRAAKLWVKGKAQRRLAFLADLGAATAEATAEVVKLSRELLEGDADTRYLVTPGGQACILSLSLATRHPDMTPEKVAGTVPYAQAWRWSPRSTA